MIPLGLRLPACAPTPCRLLPCPLLKSTWRRHRKTPSLCLDLKSIRFLREISMATLQKESIALLPVEKLEWPEPLQRVQSLAENELRCLPSKYVRPANERPEASKNVSVEEQIPVIDLSGLQDEERRHNTMEQISSACKQWGFFQLVNHGMSAELLKSALEVCRHFFSLPMEEKEKHANDPVTYEGYGSRLGVRKDAILDWGDYYFHHFLPISIRNQDKWPSKPQEYREIMENYCEGISKIFVNLMSVFSENLGLTPSSLKEAFGGEDKRGVCVRVNYYPACPQPDLAFGVSPHSDPGGMTFVLQDDIGGLEIRKDNRWVRVQPIAHALVVNLGDQLEILTNGVYKSAEHRVLVNKEKARMSLAVFCNPDGEIKIGPFTDLLNDSNPPLYSEMTFNEYRMFIRTTGTKGRDYVRSLISSA